ncbi:prepilin peptidase [Ancylomarina sp. 16SWW S1-10-2]|uniref:prepilin peptidase n=1 Tax=Ancylomarina sp. 16SWW S1-10-2 TaxID=2499681 RepID=UPI0012AD7134|nr:prepilin peptidase [Ancylomarina sp. 16SWW S1-10-2]MRT94763.1 hypothetical protein [Ancylomarina sp. 16SWW S1-10-2]
MLSKDERLEYCKPCINGKKTKDGKWLCRLTMQEPAFDWICYDYEETEVRSRCKKEDIETEIDLNNGNIDYNKLKWNELEPEKEEMFCPSEEFIERSFYLNSEIIAVPINDVRWWVIDKIPGIDLSRQLKIIIKNNFYNRNRRLWLIIGGFGLIPFDMFFSSFLSGGFAFFLSLFTIVLMGLMGYAIDRIKGRPIYSCVEINRLDSLMKFPEDNFRYVIPFKHVYFHIKGGGNVRAKAGLNLSMVMPSEVEPDIEWVPFFARYYNNKVIEALSTIVWYMDKNRPLPPGKEFDAFRQADFERRKAEGFPPPLYLSHIPTPEATAEQQTERENFWKDEDYKVTDMTTRDVIFRKYNEDGLKIPYSHLQEVWSKRKKSIIPDWMK